MDILSNILYLADKNGLSEQDLCKILGTSKSGIYHWKQGVGEPSATHLIKLSEHFSVSVDYLLGKTNVIKPLDNVATERYLISLLNDFLFSKKSDTLISMRNLLGMSQEEMARATKIDLKSYNDYESKGAIRLTEEEKISFFAYFHDLLKMRKNTSIETSNVNLLIDEIMKQKGISNEKYTEQIKSMLDLMSKEENNAEVAKDFLIKELKKS